MSNTAANQIKAAGTTYVAYFAEYAGQYVIAEDGGNGEPVYHTAVEFPDSRRGFDAAVEHVENLRAAGHIVNVGW